ncbi:putative membrane lipoprotein lipid attachment site-like protein, partial [Thalictrum thalictroides]
MKNSYTGFLSCFSSKTSAVDDNNHEEKDVESEKNNNVVQSNHCRPVLVQLFSSQGCAISPIADMLISRIGRGDFELDDMQVNILTFHVDYWDYLGWKDPFGSNQWTIRQKDYVEALE